MKLFGKVFFVFMHRFFFAFYNFNTYRCSFMFFSCSRQPINQQFQRIETGVDNTLVLRNVQRHHEGNYTCQVRNALGIDSIVYQLFVHVPPGPPELRPTTTTTTSVVLEWSIECKNRI